MYIYIYYIYIIFTCLSYYVCLHIKVAREDKLKLAFMECFFTIQ